MTLPASGAISLSQVNTELGLSSTANISLNQSSVRTLFGKASGTISMSDGYGKANQFAFTISSNTTNADLRTLAINAGWNQSTKVVATIASGVTVYSTSTGTPALTVSGSFPNGVQLTNNGTILGRGGAGAAGRPDGNSAVRNGFAGGLALSASVAISINNGSGRIAGGGGGGGGGQGGTWSPGKGASTNIPGGGGGGGIGNGAGGAAGGSGAQAGTSGTLVANGTGGAGGSAAGFTGGTGGSGGTYGSAGAGGGLGTIGGTGTNGGAAGAAVAGNANITWIATGTRNGGIS